MNDRESAAAPAHQAERAKDEVLIDDDGLERISAEQFRKMLMDFVADGERDILRRSDGTYVLSNDDQCAYPEDWPHLGTPGRFIRQCVRRGAGLKA
jgi:hypothetical protein